MVLLVHVIFVIFLFLVMAAAFAGSILSNNCPTKICIFKLTSAFTTLEAVLQYII